MQFYPNPNTNYTSFFPASFSANTWVYFHKYWRSTYPWVTNQWRKYPI